MTLAWSVLRAMMLPTDSPVTWAAVSALISVVERVLNWSVERALICDVVSPWKALIENANSWEELKP